MKKIVFALVLMSCPVLLHAGLELSAVCARESALFKTGEKITFQILLKKDGSPVAGEKLQYTLKGDGGLEQKGKLVSSGKLQEVSTQLDRPGFVLLTVTAEDGKKTLRTWAGAGVEPEKIKAATPDTPDFDAFWSAQLKELRGCRLKAEVTPVEDTKRIRFGVKVYKVMLDNGMVRGNGYLAVPPDAKPETLPIVIMFNGASTIGTTYSGLDSVAASYRALVYGMNLHDVPPDVTEKDKAKYRKSEEIRDYMYRDTADPKTYRIHKIFLRVALSLEYLKTRPEWNKHTIIARGGSLGGAQALAAAYFEPLTVLCIANAPALCDHFGADNKQAPGWPNLFVRLRKDPKAQEAARKTMAYYDMVNFARRIKCPVAMSTGFIDTICPPTSGYALYNSIPGKKSIVNVTLGMHGISLKKGEPSVFSCGGNYVSQACREVRK